MISRRASGFSKLPSNSVESRRTKTEPKPSSAHDIEILNESQKGNTHAGRSTVVRHHKGFAIDFAANRSLANYIGNNEDLKEKSENDDSDEEEGEKKKNKLVPLDPKKKPLSKLNRLKTKRLHDIYSDMYEKMDKQRRCLIMERVQTAEKIKNDLHHNELEDQRQMLKSSIEAQRKQLKEVRLKHNHDFTNRLHSLYTPKSPKVGYKTERKRYSANDPELNLSLPRNTYGLPESGSSNRPETVPSKHIYRFKPGKLLLSSYDQTRSVMPTKFNNVWTKVTLTKTSQKSAS